MESWSDLLLVALFDLLWTLIDLLLVTLFDFLAGLPPAKLSCLPQRSWWPRVELAGLVRQGADRQTDRQTTW